MFQQYIMNFFESAYLADDIYADGAIRHRRFKLSESKIPTAPSQNPVKIDIPSHEYIALEIAEESESLGYHCN